MKTVVLASARFTPLLAFCTLAACQNAPLSQPDAPLLQQASAVTPRLTNTPAASAAPLTPPLIKAPASGEATYDGQTLTVRLKLPALTTSAFHAQLLDLGLAARLTAAVTDSHGKTYLPFGADGNGQVAYPASGQIVLRFDNVLPDDLLLVEAQITETSSSALIPQAELAVALRHTSIADATTRPLSFETTAVAKTLKALLALNASRARSINLNDLDNLMAIITGISGAAPNYTYPQNHPSLVKVNTLAAALQSQDPPALSAAAASYRGTGATLNLTVTGLIGSDQLQVQLTDAASAVKTPLGNGSGAGFALGGATPSSGLKLKLASFGTPSVGYTFTTSPATLPPLTEGGSQAVTITAVPNVSVSSFSPASGTTGTTVTLTGTGFTGTTAVRFNGANASFTVDSPTRITATVPAAATDGVITVVNGSSASSASSFDTIRRIYVSAHASGVNNGSSWSDAYTNLQTALTAAGAQDEIWVAAGTYTPDPSDRSQSFQLKANVKLYGGFAGTESAVSDRTASLTDFVSILSGDLSGNDNYVTPGTTLDENAYHVVIGADNALIDGFTIQGGKANGGFPHNVGAGMFNSSVSPTLVNLTFSHNMAMHGGGVCNYLSSSPNMTNMVFIYNDVTGNGGGIYNDSYSSPILTHASFSNNTANYGGGFFSKAYSSPIMTDITFSDNSAFSGGGAMCSDSNASPTLTDAVFFHNSSALGSGGAILHESSSPMTLKNAVFSDNSARMGGGFYNIFGSSSSLTNVTFSHNTDSFNGGGIYNSNSTYPLTLKNVLFWASPTYNQTLSPLAGVITASSDPFVDSANPLGADGIPRTADDGLRIISTASAVINQGVSGANVPTSDILGNARVGNPEPGAYEYQPSLPANVITVSKTATGTQNGSSWANAYTDMQAALAAADGTVKTEIWVAAGTYTPHASDRAVSFVMKPNVKIYGGFAGTETALSARTASLTDYVSILSGDLLGNDNYTTPGTTLDENSQTVVKGANNALLDGFTIQGGNGLEGGGMFNNAASPTLSNLTFIHNKASSGGGMANFSASAPSLTNVNFFNNTVDFNGGGMINGSSSPILNQVTFADNSAYVGGGMINLTSSAPILKNVTFAHNTVLSNGGGMANLSSSPSVTNGVFVNNTAGTGGGVSNQYSSVPLLTNVTFANNTATLGGGIYNDSGSLPLKNVLFWQSPVINQSLNAGAGVFEAASDPFVNSASPSGADGIPRTADDGLRIRSTASSLLNQGVTGTDVPTTDILGQARVGSPEPGAYEYTP